MIQSKRHRVGHKHAAARAFNNDARKTHPKNMAMAPMRGGRRL